MAEKAELEAAVRDCAAARDRVAGTVAVAVSGGVDSLTLAAFAHRALGGRSTMFHAVSPAVPQAATTRVRALAEAAGWQLRVFDAGEFADDRYRANPANRCFFCKTNLYGALSALTGGQLVSGTNTDDLGDWRPGLAAARDHDVRHPFVEAGFAKSDVRALARDLGLGEVAELPAAPCLSSRVETGIAIEAPTLVAIDRCESWLRTTLQAETVRCRVRGAGVVVELDPVALELLNGEARSELARAVRRIFADVDPIAGSPDAAPAQPGPTVSFEGYQRGSAFLRETLDPPDVTGAPIR